MSPRSQSIRLWWQPPRRAGDRPQYRQVTFLELFYDLVYVVLISKLSGALSANISWIGLRNFSFLFFIVWWAWLNGTLYHDIHGNNDIRTRFFTFLQMVFVVSMAVFAGDAMGKSSTGFALSYALFQLVLTILWWRTGVHDADHRPLSRPYSAVFFLNSVLFAVSAFVSPPQRFLLWGIALFFSLLLPVLTFTLGYKNSNAREQIKIMTTVSPSTVERFGLLTIIVLGEVIVGVVAGVSKHQDMSWNLGGTALLGTLIAIGIWWVYFDFVSHRIPRPKIFTVSIWFYLHLPVTMGITAVGAAVLNIVDHAGDQLPSEVRLLLTASLAVILISIALLIHTLQQTEEHQKAYRKGSVIMLISAILIAVLGFTELRTFHILGALILLLPAPVFYGFLVWLEKAKNQ
jgi:low temperature requirement protein LtrA